MKRLVVLLCVLSMLFAQSAFAAFSDVTEDYPEQMAINWLSDQGVVEGYADGSYQPNRFVNRVEFLKMLYETTGFEEVDVELPFSDVGENEWYMPYLKAAYNDGVVEGYSDGTFKPDNKIVFAEAMKIIMNGFYDMENLTVKEYTGEGINLNVCANEFGDMYDLSEDISTSDWFYDYITKADELCLFDFDLNAFDANGLNPGLEVDRGDMAELLYRAKSVQDYQWDEYLPYNGFLIPFDLDSQDVETDYFGFKIPADWVDYGFNDKWWMYSTPDYSEVDVDMQGNATVEQGMKVLVTVEENSEVVPETVEGANINMSVTLNEAVDIYSMYMAEDGQTQIEQHQLLTPDNTFIYIRAYYQEGETEHNAEFAEITKSLRYQ